MNNCSKCGQKRTVPHGEHDCKTTDLCKVDYLHLNAMDLEYENAEGRVYEWPVIISQTTPSGDPYFIFSGVIVVAAAFIPLLLLPTFGKS